MRHKFLLLALASVLVMAFIPGVASAEPIELTGDRINVLSGDPTEYPADTAFFVVHGISTAPPGQEDLGTGRHTAGQLFELYVDHEPIAPSFIRFGAFGRGGVAHWWVFNFPGGLGAGDHRFDGRWYLPCAVVEGDLVDKCDHPNTPVMFLEQSLTVHFNEEP